MGEIIDMFNFAEEDKLGREWTSSAASSELTPLPVELEVTMPFSAEAEKTLIALILHRPNKVLSICLEKRLRPEDFFDPRHRKTYRVLVEQWEKRLSIDTLTISQKLQSDPAFANLNAHDFVKGFQIPANSEANEILNVGLVLEKSLLRRLVAVTTQCANQCSRANATVDDLIGELRAAIATLSLANRQEEERRMKDHVLDAIEAVEMLYDGKGAISGLTSGFPDIDQLTDGFHVGSVTTVLGMGANTFALNVIGHVALNLKRAVGIFSPAVSSKEIASRLLYSRARVSKQRLRKGFLQDSDFPRLTEAASQLAESHIHIDNTVSLSIARLRGRVERLQERYSVELIYLDRLDLLKTDAGASVTNETAIAETLTALKTMAKELGVMLLICSPSGDREDLLKHFERSPLTELSDTCVCFPPLEDIEGDSEVVNVAICRSSENMVEYVALLFFKAFFRFESLSEETQEGDEKDVASNVDDDVATTASTPEQSREELLTAYHELVDKKLSNDLTRAEEAMLNDISQELDAYDLINVTVDPDLRVLDEQSKELATVLHEVERYLAAFLERT